MKKMNFFAVLFGLIAICAAAAAVWLGFTNQNAAPVLLEKNYLAQSQAVATMNALCKGDFDGVSQRMLGQPDLGLDREPAEDVGRLMWQSYVDSLSYELVGECYSTDTGLAQNVKLTCMDLDSVTTQLRDYSMALLEERVENTRNLKEIYDEDYNYREEFVMGVLLDAAAALLENAGEKNLELTLNLRYQDGQWWVVPDNTLLDVLSGGTLN